MLWHCFLTYKLHSKKMSGELAVCWITSKCINGYYFGSNSFIFFLGVRNSQRSKTRIGEVSQGYCLLCRVSINPLFSARHWLSCLQSRPVPLAFNQDWYHLVLVSLVLTLERINSVFYLGRIEDLVFNNFLCKFSTYSSVYDLIIFPWIQK